MSNEVRKVLDIRKFQRMSPMANVKLNSWSTVLHAPPCNNLYCGIWSTWQIQILTSSLSIEHKTWKIIYHIPCRGSTLDKLFLWGIYPTITPEIAIKLNSWGTYPNTSIFCTLNKTLYPKKNPDTQFSEKWVGNNSPKYPIAQNLI